MKKIGIYIHIPFCKQKCLYCDFVSFANRESMQKEYAQAIKKEIENWKKLNKDYKIKTIYIGGGTPSYIDSKDIVDILNAIKGKIENTNETADNNKKGDTRELDEINIKENQAKKDISVTIEINPGTITKPKLEDYKKAGVNRLSIGLQSTQDFLLKQIGRIHNYQQFIETYNLAREVGFKNINVDLMLGLPNQSIQDLKESLEKICELEPEHISVFFNCIG